MATRFGVPKHGNGRTRDEKGRQWRLNNSPGGDTSLVFVEMGRGGFLGVHIKLSHAIAWQPIMSSLGRELTSHAIGVAQKKCSHAKKGHRFCRLTSQLKPINKSLSRPFRPAPRIRSAVSPSSQASFPDLIDRYRSIAQQKIRHIAV
jgi:hypothetical protein